MSRTDAIIWNIPTEHTINGCNYYVSTLTHDGRMEYAGLTIRSKRLPPFCVIMSTLLGDVWMVLNVCTVKFLMLIR